MVGFSTIVSATPAAVSLSEKNSIHHTAASGKRSVQRSTGIQLLPDLTQSGIAREQRLLGNH